MELAGSVVIFLGGPLSTIYLSRFAQSPLAKRILRYGGLYYLVVFALPYILEWDCDWLDLGLSHCSVVPQALADGVSIVLMVSLISFVLVAPVLILIAIWAEVQARRR